MSVRPAFLCQRPRCSKNILRVELDEPVQVSTIRGFHTTGNVPLHIDRKFTTEEKQTLDKLEESFVVVPTGSSARAQGSSRSFEQVELLQKVFEIASDKCQIDHPLCSTCCTAINRELDQNLKQVTRERDAMRAFLDNEPVQRNENQKGDDAYRISLEEKQLRDRLTRVRAERTAVQNELAYLKDQEKRLDSLYERFWRDFQDVEHQLLLTQAETFSVNRKMKHTTRLLDQLRRTNVLNDAFYISHDGHFGTINGFRLGRLDSVTVDSAETNAGLGQVVLLLDTLANQIGYEWKKYTLQPCGSFSKMAKKSDPDTQLELYGSNYRSLARSFWYNHFDTALCWLLECVHELSSYAQLVDPSGFESRHEIKVHNHTIGGISVKCQINQSEKYTKALKLLLTRCKALLLWTAKQPRTHRPKRQFEMKTQKTQQRKSGTRR